MKWYSSLPRSSKVHIRWAFEACLGMSLNSALCIFSFSECMELLYNKLKLEGIL